MDLNDESVKSKADIKIKAYLVCLSKILFV